MIVIDCDPGWDDAIAILLARDASHARIQAITTVFGNGPIQETTSNARRVAAFGVGPEVVVYQGCDRPISGRGRTLPVASTSATIAALATNARTGDRGAVDFLIDAARRYGPALTILATGPLTNVATALMREPHVMAVVGELIVMGGALRSGNVTRHAEFNFFLDAKAAKIVLASVIPKVVIPLETCHLLPADDAFLKKLGKIDTPRSSIVSAIVAERLAMREKGDRVPLYDVLALLFALEPGIFTLQAGAVDVEAVDAQRLGRMLFVPGERNANAQVAVSLNAQAAYALIYKILSAT